MRARQLVDLTRAALYADGVQHFSLFFVPWHRTRSHIVVQLKLKRVNGKWLITQQTDM